MWLRVWWGLKGARYWKGLTRRAGMLPALPLSPTMRLLTAGTLSANHHKGKGPMMGGKMLEKMDTDKDGFLTKDEMKAHHQQMMKEHGPKDGPEGEGHHGQGKKKRKKTVKEEDEEKPE